MVEFRYFNGNRFQLQHTRDKKGSAQLLANDLRKNNYLVRIVKDSKTKEYGVYARRKRGLSY